MTKLKFAPPDARIDLATDLVDDLLHNQAAPRLQSWADEIAQKMDELPCGLAFSIGRLRLPMDESCQIAHQIAHQVCQGLKRREAPGELYVEIDTPQTTSVKPGHQARTLLPHHDGGHCTYLTPSRLDVPEAPFWMPVQTVSRTDTVDTSASPSDFFR